MSELDRAGRSQLHYAALSGDIEELSRLVRAGADVNLADRDGFTPLHFAAQELELAAVDALLAAGSSVDPRDHFGNTPLFKALFNVRDGDGEAVRVLLAAGADPDIENNAGVSPRKLAGTVANFDLMRFLE